MKYEGVWKSQAYRDASVHRSEKRIAQLEYHLRSVGALSVLDVGCGTGRTAKILEGLGFDVEGIDITEKGLEEDIPFTRVPIWDASEIGRFDAVICIDVLEHIPNEYVQRSLDAIERLAPHGYLVIALREERMKFEEPLHLTVETAEWWNEKIRFADVEANLSGTHAIARY